MAEALAFALFDTAIGRCAIGWRGARIVGLRLPEASEGRLRSVVAQQWPSAEEAEPPPAVADAIALIARLLAGEKLALDEIDVDLSRAPAFERSVWEAARRIPPGEVRTYGEIAREIGQPGAARAVGVALGRNPVPVIVPCHRILAGGGKTGGFSAPGGVATKFRLLEIEGARRAGEGGLFDTLPLAVKP
jgi:methylated-DNA-[protein]-cysteine S-methyltransferase